MKTVFIDCSPKRNFSASGFIAAMTSCFVFGSKRKMKLRTKADHEGILKELEDALREIANDDFADNLCKAINEGEDDDWEKTDMAFYELEPSLTTLLEEYVEANRDLIFD